MQRITSLYLVTTAVAADGDFTKAAKSSFNLAALTAMCPVSTLGCMYLHSQVDSVLLLSPVVEPVPDEAFTVPSS